MNRLLLALLVCAACKHSSSASSTSHAETQTVTDSTSSESGSTTTVTTTSEAPGRTTTTVEDYVDDTEPVSSGDSSAGDQPDGVAGDDAPATVAPRPRQPRIVRRTVTVTEHGPTTSETRQEATQQAAGATETRAQAQGDTKAQTQEASAPSAGCVGASWLWGLGILAFAVAVILGILKFRKPI